MFVTYSHPDELRDHKKKHLVSRYSTLSRPSLNDQLMVARQWIGKSQNRNSGKASQAKRKCQRSENQNGHDRDRTRLPLYQARRFETLLADNIDPLASFSAGLDGLGAKAFDYCTYEATLALIQRLKSEKSVMCMHQL